MRVRLMTWPLNTSQKVLVTTVRQMVIAEDGKKAGFSHGQILSRQRTGAGFNKKAIPVFPDYGNVQDFCNRHGLTLVN